MPIPPAKHLILRSLESSHMDLESFIAEFYRVFFALSPQSRALFPKDTTRLETKMLAALTHLAEAVDSSARLDAILNELGAKHRNMQISDAHFDMFIQSFIIALAKTLGPDWDDDSAQAWDGFLRFVANRMSYGDKAATRPQSTTVPPPASPPVRTNDKILQKT